MFARVFIVLLKELQLLHLLKRSPPRWQATVVELMVVLHCRLLNYGVISLHAGNKNDVDKIKLVV